MEPDQPRSAGPSLRSLVREALGIRELVHVALALVLLIFVAIPFAHVLRLGSWLPILFGFALVIGVSRIPISPRAAAIAIATCFAVFVVIQIVIVCNHWIEPVSDFRTQWQTAVEWARDGLGTPDRPQTQRAIPFYFPLVKLFGDSPRVYLTANVVLTSLTFAMAVWIARRYFGWQAAAKTSILLLCTFEPYFANTFPSHDVPGAFGVLLVLTILAELDARVEGVLARGRPRVVAIALAVALSLAITWVDWQRGLGVFCILGVVFYGIAPLVQRAPRARLRIGIAGAVIAFSLLQSCGLKSCGLAATQQPTQLTATEVSLLVFGTDEGDGRFADWLRNARLAVTLSGDQITSLGKQQIVETLRSAPAHKYGNYLDRQAIYLRTGNDSAFYLAVDSPRWLSKEQVRGIFSWCQKYTPPIWWAIALLLLVAAFARRSTMFDPRLTPLIIIGAFMTLMGLLNEAQSRYALFMVFLWPIYAGSPWIANPLAGVGRVDQRTAGRTIGRLAIGALIVLAIPTLAVCVSPRVLGDRLVDFGRVPIAFGPRPGADSPGTPPQTAVTRNILTVADAAVGSEQQTVTIATDLAATREANTLRFVVYNENGDPIEPPESPVPEHPSVIPHRALRVFVDDALARTVELTTPNIPLAYEIPGIAEGTHAIRLELDLGDAHERAKSANPKCTHRWTSPATCTNTSIAYLGFY